MSYQNTFKRYEFKYLLNPAQKEALQDAMNGRMELDSYGRTTIRNIYFDTDDHRLIRASIDKPIYKEKLRVRSYEQAGAKDTVFVELKKKYNGVVYKRRVALPLEVAMSWLSGKSHLPISTQITDEIDYALHFYNGLKPKAFITYEREAYKDVFESDFRVTLDENILHRDSRLSLSEKVDGQPILPEGMTLMELKVSDSIPLWMADFLCKNNVPRVNYSKYGAAYKYCIAATRLERSALYA